jgi:hypothetical protein
LFRFGVGRPPLEGFAVKKLILILMVSMYAGVFVRAGTNTATVLVVAGAPGEPDYGKDFAQQAADWEKACRLGNAEVATIGLATNTEADLYLIKRQLVQMATNDMTPLWLVFIGHGTYDGKEARFNLRGPDLSATQLAEWLKPFQRKLILIDTTSSSAPFLNKLAATNRCVITATRNGSEHNYARFGQYLAQAIANPKSDLDGDGATSLLEAFLSASASVAEWYKTEGRLATEHPLLEDNGDGLGTPPDWFRGVRAIKKPAQGSADGARAQQIFLILNPAELALSPEIRARRDVLELQVIQWRDRKGTVPEDEYYNKLETFLLELARIQAATFGGK